MAKYAASGELKLIFIALENIRQYYEQISYDFISLMQFFFISITYLKNKTKKGRKSINVFVSD